MSGEGCWGRGAGVRGGLAAALMLALALVGRGTTWAAAVARVEVKAGDREVTVSVHTSDPQPLKLESFSLNDPARLVFDLNGAVLAPDQPDTIPVGAAGIRQVRVGQFQSEPSVARLVLDLEANPPPLWRRAEGGTPGETAIVLRPRGPAVLRAAAVTKLGESVLVRLAGAAGLPRRAATLEDPPRIYADVSELAVAASSRQEFSDGLVREVRMGQQPSPTGHPVSRVVVELRKQEPYILFCDGPDLVLAVGGQPWALPLPAYHGAGRLKGKRIVVDPGHGGRDVGAPAVPGPPAEGPFEKDIVLDLAARLARLLRAEGAAVTMTREDDTFIALADRAAVANELKADAFVSVHCNSCPAPNTLCGTSVYYDHENSVGLAEMVQEELVAGLGTEDKGVRNANFAVIRRTRGPGILVETAFINDEGDRARLTNPNSRERAARAILQGVIRFLSQAERGDDE